ncbi:ADAMTS-like protein 4 [Frankliniella fusca]|uniref:Regulatory protein zeste n=1 Tax=Frankliniella fusca TaxID=407009 RepID=A0AAE1HLV0_9NEOP|nr:ADAMTS-like protein 4 [Frankliniella fusca]
MLVFMEGHPDFARGRVNAAQAAQVKNRLWKKLADLLNDMPGATKTVAKWKELRKCQFMRSDAKQYGCSNGVPKPTKTGGGGMSSDDDDDNIPFQTDNSFVNRILAITGWDLVFGVGVKDDLDTSDEDSVVIIEPLPVLEKPKPAPPQPQVHPLLKAMDNLKKAIQRQEDLIAELRSMLP